MNVLVFIKPIRMNLIYANVGRQEEYTINPYDMLCIQKLIRLKEKVNMHITCVTMGPRIAEQVLVRCIALGCDAGVLLSDEVHFAGSDTSATSNILTFAARKMEYDYIVCGNKSVDGATGQVKYEIAELLDLEHYSNVLDIEEADRKSLVLKIDNEKEVQIVKVRPPAMLSFQQFAMKSEALSLFRIKEISKKDIAIWNAEDIGISGDLCGGKGSKTVVSRIMEIKQSRDALIIKGSARNQVCFIKNLLEKSNIYG